MLLIRNSSLVHIVTLAVIFGSGQSQEGQTPRTTLISAQCDNNECCSNDCITVQDEGGLDICLKSLSNSCHISSFYRETLPDTAFCTGISGIRIDLSYSGTSGVGVLSGIYIPAWNDTDCDRISFKPGKSIPVSTEKIDLSCDVQFPDKETAPSGTEPIVLTDPDFIDFDKFVIEKPTFGPFNLDMIVYKHTNISKTCHPKDSNFEGVFKLSRRGEMLGGIAEESIITTESLSTTVAEAMMRQLTFPTQLPATTTRPLFDTQQSRIAIATPVLCSLLPITSSFLIAVFV